MRLTRNGEYAHSSKVPKFHVLGLAVISTGSIRHGKVPRRPSLEELDGRAPREDEASTAAGGHRTNDHLFADAGRTWPRDKALLIVLGVDGDIDLAQARQNADGRFAIQLGDGWLVMPAAANDNSRIAARAA